MTLKETTEAIRNLNPSAPSYRNEIVTILKKYGQDQYFDGYEKAIGDVRKAIDNIKPIHK